MICQFFVDFFYIWNFYVCQNSHNTFKRRNSMSYEKEHFLNIYKTLELILFYFNLFFKLLTYILYKTKRQNQTFKITKNAKRNRACSISKDTIHCIQHMCIFKSVYMVCIESICGKMTYHMINTHHVKVS